MARTESSDDKLQILVLEDDDSIAELLIWVLSEAGYETRCASSIREARRLALESDPDIIIADLLLPDGLGTDLLAELRQSRNGNMPPCIVMSAMPIARKHADAAGARVCLSKPFDLTELLGEISCLTEVEAGAFQLQPQ